MLNEMERVLIDLEFTGLDNSFTRDNEIVQVKMMNKFSKKIVCRNFNSNKIIGAHTQLFLKTPKFDGPLFTDVIFFEMLSEIVTQNSNALFYGYSVSQDLLMLSKYGIHIDIHDIKETIQLSHFEVKIATEGSSLEAAYLIVTGKHCNLKNHDGIDEIEIIRDLLIHAEQLQLNEFLTVMPFGHCSGMPLNLYIQEYRRAADGYRFNNNDLLSRSLDNAIETFEQKELEEMEMDDYDDRELD